MALRTIVLEGDSILRKKSREVDKFDDRLATLLEDMADTMHDAEGAGLAAPQVGVLKRVVVIDVGHGVIELVNPKIVVMKGSQIGPEGCLSSPGESAEIKRPNYVKVEAYDRHGKKFAIDGTQLLARAFCHEIDHLNGVLFKDLIQGK